MPTEYSADSPNPIITALKRLYPLEEVPASKSIEEIIKEKLLDLEQEDPFFILDISQLTKQYEDFIRLLPRVEPYYAVKCNPNPVILNTLRLLGTKFDCASKGEIEQVLSMPGTTAEDIIYANPCKPKIHLSYAQRKGVKRMTFDNVDELRKIKDVHPEAELVLRIITDDSSSVCKFSTKYGAHMKDCYSLLDTCKELGLNLIGVSFHVGSGCSSSDSFVKAIESARKIFDIAQSKGFDLELLDIGGGFPGTTDRDYADITFEEIARAVSPKLDELFPNTKIIAEPGRYFATSTCAIACNVIAKRKVFNTSDYDSYLYYINDGVYGSFNSKLYDHASPRPLDLLDRQSLHKSTVFGPTCDSLDLIIKDYAMPLLEVGDWLYFKNMGAYTMAAASQFNGFELTKIHYIYRQE